MSRCCLWKDFWFGWKFSCMAVTRKPYSRSVYAISARMPLPASVSRLSLSRTFTMAVGDWFRSSLESKNFPPDFQTQPSGAARAALTRAWKSHLSEDTSPGATPLSASCTVPPMTVQISPSWPWPSLHGQLSDAQHVTTESSVPSEGEETRLQRMSFPSSLCVRNEPSVGTIDFSMRLACSISIAGTLRIFDRVICAKRLAYFPFSMALTRACCWANLVSSFFFACLIPTVMTALKPSEMLTSTTVPSPLAPMPLPSSSCPAPATTLRCLCSADTKFMPPSTCELFEPPTWTPKGMGGTPATCSIPAMEPELRREMLVAVPAGSTAGNQLERRSSSPSVSSTEISTPSICGATLMLS
mmetsp:Transcript_90116/g.162529  ORF Transcript_90116/g.162529 Transcript_90116/m.162529 type:complete len:357 (-) Transcript_90116:413-1483(-)